jgi:hypothetical protein
VNSSTMMGSTMATGRVGGRTPVGWAEEAAAARANDNVAAGRIQCLERMAATLTTGEAMAPLIFA